MLVCSARPHTGTGDALSSTTATRDLPATAASRLRPPSWKDPRLLIGVLLVVGSVVLGARLVQAADRTEPYFAARHALTPGDRVGPDDVAVVRLTLRQADSTYLSAAADLPEGLVAVRTVGAGELVPRAGVGAADDLDVQPVGVPVEGALPAGLVKGAVVDVWVASPDPDRAGAFLPPERLVEGAEVAEVAESGRALGAAGGSTVQVLVGPDPLQAVLGALANDAAVALVLAPGQGG